MSALVVLSVGGCDTLNSWVAPVDTPTLRTRYLGSVVGDEPTAVGAGDQILRNKGNAADAAAAMALTLAVTLPSRAGLMGGGVCLVRDAQSADVQALEFLPKTVAGSAVEVPGLVRGIAALQARYGVLDWRQVVVGVERLANAGAPASAQLSADAAAAGVPLAGQGRPDPALAAVFGQLRVNGATDFYTGDVARQLAAAGVPTQALADYAPSWRPAYRLESGNDWLYLPPGIGGRVAAAAYKSLLASDSAESDRAARFQTARAAAAQALAKAAPGIAVQNDQPNASTGFVVADVDGRAISCSLSMGALFGTRQKLPAAALYTAAPIGGDPAAQLGLVPAIAYNANVGQVLGVYVGSGGSSAPGDLAAAMFGMLRNDEPAVPSLAALRRPGDTGATAVPDRLAAINCPGGLVRNPKGCAVAKDPRGWGYAQTVDLLR